MGKGWREGVPPKCAILQNEANFPRCWRLWIDLMDNVLEVLVRQFVTWLRLLRIGFVCDQDLA
jgi:hypothetical protein